MKKRYLALMFGLATSLLAGCSKEQSTVTGSSQNQQEEVISRITAVASSRPNIHPKTKEAQDAYNAYLEKEKVLIKDLIGKKVQNWSCTIGENSASIDLMARLTQFPGKTDKESKFECFGNKDHRTSGSTKNLDNQIFNMVLNETDARKIGKLGKGNQVKFSGTISELYLGLGLEFNVGFQNMSAELIK